MIIVKNTLEFEKLYDINKLNDNEMVMITGGLDKPKYMNDPKYQKRVTYTLGELKEILQKIHIIESKLNPAWNKKQIALYIYSIMEKGLVYNHEYDLAKNIDNSLRTLIAGKGVCAGFSLIYKELMDRQGIQCDYVRGRDKKTGEKHAWNVLSFDNEHFLVDITNGLSNFRTMGQQFTRFGYNPVLFECNKEDDEVAYNCTTLSIGQINDILNNRNYLYDFSSAESTIRPYNNALTQNGTGDARVDRRKVIDYAIQKTFSKFKSTIKNEDTNYVIAATIANYIETGNSLRITNDGNARNLIVENQISQEEILDSIIETYVENILSGDMHIPPFTSDGVCSYEINYKTHTSATSKGRIATNQALKQYIISLGGNNTLNLTTSRSDVLYLMCMEKALHIENQRARIKNNNIDI